MKLAGSTIWLTGATSGIGEALAHELVLRGATVALTARRHELLGQLAEALRAKGGTVVIAPGDVVDRQSMHAVARHIERELGTIDVLVANAGTHIFTFPEQFDSAEYEHVMHTNFGGMLHCIEASLPSMLARGSGTIVGMGSLAGYRGLPTAAAYGASKAAIIHFLESVRFHLRRQGVRVIIVNPGFVKTPLTDKNKFRMPFLVSPEQAAREICTGLERGRSKITFPKPFNWMLELTRVLPYPLYDLLIERVWRRM